MRWPRSGGFDLAVVDGDEGRLLSHFMLLTYRSSFRKHAGLGDLLGLEVQAPPSTWHFLGQNHMILTSKSRSVSDFQASSLNARSPTSAVATKTKFDKQNSQRQGFEAAKSCGPGRLSRSRGTACGCRVHRTLSHLILSLRSPKSHHTVWEKRAQVSLLKRNCSTTIGITDS